MPWHAPSSCSALRWHRSSLRIGLHTGEIQLRDESNYIGPTINRASRVRDLAHGGQTVLTAATEELVLDHLPSEGMWLTDLGSHKTTRHSPVLSALSSCRIRTYASTFRLCESRTAVVDTGSSDTADELVGRATEISELVQNSEREPPCDPYRRRRCGETRLAVEFVSSARRRLRRPQSTMSTWPPSPMPVLSRERSPGAFGMPDQPGYSTDRRTRPAA